MVASVQLLVASAFFTLLSASYQQHQEATVEPNITSYLSESPPFLGADVATSIPLSFSNGSISLWLFGDTITGSWEGGHRTIAVMPRNSVGLFHTIKGVPQSSFSHFIRYASDPSTLKHVGFWSPDDASHWLCSMTNISVTLQLCIIAYFAKQLQTYGNNASRRYWPTAGLELLGDVFVLAMNMMDFGGGLFPFALSSQSFRILPHARAHARLQALMSFVCQFRRPRILCNGVH
jgi:hypothetical protein